MTLTWTSRRTKVTALAVAALLLGGLCWFSITVRNADRCIVSSMQMSSVLKAYAKDHQGRLPSSLNELIETGYLRCDNDGVLREVQNKVGSSNRFHGASFFDVAWGITADQIDANGYLPAHNRFLIVPAADSPCSAGWCEGTSKQVAEAMKAAARAPQ